MYGGNVRDEEVGEEGEGKHGEEADDGVNVGRGARRW
jgi:hypothetical protein